MKLWSEMSAAEIADKAAEIADNHHARANLSNPYVLIECLARRVAALEARTPSPLAEQDTKEA